MNALNQPWIEALGWALVHFLWQGLLVWAGVALSLRLLRAARPTARYAVAVAGLGLCLALPVCGMLRHLPSRPAATSLQAPSPLRWEEAP